MDVLKNYIDNAFAGFPQTDEVQKMRRDMQANMEEKYSALRQSGKSEHEAAYSVIADFGSIEELTEELGLDTGDAGGSGDISLTWGDAEEYLAKTKLYGVLVGLGVWLIIAGVSSVVVIGGGGVMVMFAAIAAAVVMFIASGALLRKYEHYEEENLRFEPADRKLIEDAAAKFHPIFTAMIAGGVAIIILAVGATTMIGSVVIRGIEINFENGAICAPGINIATGAGAVLFLNAIGFAVFLFVAACSYRPAFDILLNKGDYENKKAEKKAGKLIGLIAAFYWPGVTALGVGLMFFGVDNFWVVWPISGILFGGICAAASYWYAAKYPTSS